MKLTTLSDLLALYERKGKLQYSGESVTQLMHAWQCFLWGMRDGATPSMLLAAFFHDVGHLFQADTRSPTLEGINDFHEKVGASLLARVFNRSVSLPVAMHVDAKRYLVATDLSYLALLSDDSLRSLELQGGPMTAGEQSLFKKNVFHQEAISLRRWDEKSKEAGINAPSIASIESMLLACAEGLTINTNK